MRRYGFSMVRSILAWFDGVVYSLLSLICQTIPLITNFQLSHLYKMVQERVFVILGIFMLFKVTISFLTYLVNPDKINDKQQGVGKVVTRIIVALLMLIAIDPFFETMTVLQTQLIPVVPKLVTGQAINTDVTNDDGSINFEAFGNQLGLEAYRSFTQVHEGCNEDVYVFKELQSPMDMADHINDACVLSEDGEAVDKSQYQYNYFPIVPFVVGIIMIVVMLGICIDIAIRAIKLVLLRAMAPIAIMSYIDPKSSKDGAFNNWTKMLISTWLSLFINLGIVYGALTLIGSIFSKDMFSSWFEGLDTNPLLAGIISILLIIAILFFAREVPKFIMDALGIKDAGSFGKMLGVAAAGLGMAGAARSSYMASRAADATLGRNPNLLRNVGAGLFGGIAGGISGAGAALSAKDHNARAVMDALAKRNARAMELGAQGGTFFGGVGAAGQRFFTGQTTNDVLEAQWKQEEEAIKAEEMVTKNMQDANAHRKNIMNRASSKGLESLKTQANIDGFRGVSGREYHMNANAAKFNSVYQAAMDRGEKDHFEFVDENGDRFEVKMDDAKLLQHEINDGNIADYAERAISGDIDDASIRTDAQLFHDATGQDIEATYNGAGGLKAAFGNASGQIASRSDATNRRRTNLNNQRNSAAATSAKANDARFKGGR